MLINERLYQILKIVKILFEIKIHFFQYLLCHCCNIVKKKITVYLTWINTHFSLEPFSILPIASVNLPELKETLREIYLIFLKHYVLVLIIVYLTFSSYDTTHYAAHSSK